jgi:DNA-directed RNA polymerase subunit RPC12/RpoP
MSNRFSCNRCNKTFTRKSNLKRHQDSVHSTERPFQCPYCSFSTKRKDILDRHIREKHFGVRYNCEICKESFTQLTSLKRHANSVHNQKKTYKCDFCDVEFPRKDNLVRHVNSVHQNLRPHVCTECGDVFKLPQHLKEHIVAIHTNQRKYICKECGFAFKLLSHLNDHVRVVHQNHRPYACEECDSAFPHARDLKLHIIAMHTDEKPFVCEDCGRGFADPSHLYRHKEAEACRFTSTTAYKWEELCKEIAEVLLEGLDWKWKPKIDTPEIAEQSWIQPEIVVYYENNTKRIIDAKRSTQAIFKEKDLKVYPKLAEKVEFWCLYGKAEGMFEDEQDVEAKLSMDIIKEIEQKKSIKNKQLLENLIMKIILLRKGFDSEGQTQLAEFIEEKT